MTSTLEMYKTKNYEELKNKYSKIVPLTVQKPVPLEVQKPVGPVNPCNPCNQVPLVAQRAVPDLVSRVHPELVHPEPAHPGLAPLASYSPLDYKFTAIRHLPTAASLNSEFDMNKYMLERHETTIKTLTEQLEGLQKEECNDNEIKCIIDKEIVRLTAELENTLVLKNKVQEAYELQQANVLTEEQEAIVAQFPEQLK